MSAEYPPWIAAYLAHALGSNDAAAAYKPTGRVQRCMQSGTGACGRLGYWFRGADRFGESVVVVWDGKTTGASASAIEYGMVDPDRPYGFDSGRRLDEYGWFGCGWCGHPNREGAPRSNPSPAARRSAFKRSPERPARPMPAEEARPSASQADEARRLEIEAWAEKLEKVNPEMAKKVRALADLPPPRR